MSSTSLSPSNYYQILGGNLKCTMSAPTIISETATSVTFGISNYTLYFAGAKTNGKVRFQRPDGSGSGGVAATKGSTVTKNCNDAYWQFTVSKTHSAQTITKTFVIELTYDGNSSSNQNTKTGTTYVDAKTSYSVTYNGASATKGYDENLWIGTPGKSDTVANGSYKYYPNYPGQEGNADPVLGSAPITSSYTFRGGDGTVGSSTADDGFTDGGYNGNSNATLTSDYSASASPTFISHPSGTTLNGSKTGFTYKGLATSSSATAPDTMPAYLHYREFGGVWTHTFTFTNYGSNRNSSSSSEQYVASGAKTINNMVSHGTSTGFTFKCGRRDGIDYSDDTSLPATTTSGTYKAIGNHSQTINANSGTGGGTYTEESNVAVQPVPVYKKYYEVSSYNTAADGTGTTITLANASLPAETASRTLYAQWEKGTYTVSFNSNGGTTSVASFDVVSADGAEMIPAIGSYTPPDDSQRFLEWNTSPDGTGTSYSPGDDIRPEEDTILYAIGTLKQIYVKLEDNQTMQGFYINVPE